MGYPSIKICAISACLVVVTALSNAEAAVDNSQPPSAVFCSGSCGVGSAIGFSRTVPQAVPNDTTTFTDIWTITLSEPGNINGIMFANNTLNTFRLIDLNLGLEQAGTPVDPAGGFTVPNPPPFNAILQTAVVFSGLDAGAYQFVVTGIVPTDQVAGQYEFQGGISEVPLPAAGWLMLTALLGLIGWTRAGNKTASIA